MSVGPLDHTFNVPGAASPGALGTFAPQQPGAMGTFAPQQPAMGTFAPQQPAGSFAGGFPIGGPAGAPMTGMPLGSGVGPPLGSSAGPLAGAPPPGSAFSMTPPPVMPPGSSFAVPSAGGPPSVGPFATRPPPPTSSYGPKYEVARQQVQERLQAAMQKRGELLAHIQEETNGLYQEHLRTKFSPAGKANVTGIDWRVPRLQFCKDPVHNQQMNPIMAFEVQERKAADSRVLEYELSKEANANWAAALLPVGMAPPPLEKVYKPRVSFVEASPNYVAEDDVWTRRLELRTLEEAMRGDVSRPMPRPVLFAEDYENYHQGKYVKDDCPIA